MNFFGIGGLEFLFILVIILLVAGPKDIAKTARNLGRLLNRVYRSPSYHAIRRASDELRDLPKRLVEEAQLEDLKEAAGLKELKGELKDVANSIGGDPQPYQAWVAKAENPAPSAPAVPEQPAPSSTASPSGAASSAGAADAVPRRPPTGAPRPETTAALRARAAEKLAASAPVPPAPDAPIPDHPEDQEA